MKQPNRVLVSKNKFAHLVFYIVHGKPPQPVVYMASNGVVHLCTGHINITAIFYDS